MGAPFVDLRLYFSSVSIYLFLPVYLLPNHMRTFGKKNIPRILRCWRDLLFKAIGEFVYGAAAHDMVCYTIRLRAETENIFMLAILGDLIGLPIMPPYYALRLLPYMVPQIETWKRRVLREKDFLETEGLELVG